MLFFCVDFVVDVGVVEVGLGFFGFLLVYNICDKVEVDVVLVEVVVVGVCFVKLV